MTGYTSRDVERVARAARDAYYLASRSDMYDDTGVAPVWLAVARAALSARPVEDVVSEWLDAHDRVALDRQDAVDAGLFPGPARPVEAPIFTWDDGTDPDATPMSGEAAVQYRPVEACPNCGSEAYCTPDCQRTESVEAQEVERLRAWKGEALHVMAGLQDLGQALGMGLGERITGETAAEKARALVARAEAAEGERDALREAGLRLADDLRGLRISEAPEWLDDHLRALLDTDN